MRNVQRYYVPNAIVFITIVTRARRPLFSEDRWVELLFDTLRATSKQHPFRLLAYVVITEHVHWLMQTPPPHTFSEAIHAIKRNFTLNYKRLLTWTDSISLWQPRFYDHIVRNEDDLWHHFDYIHYNPVKHGLVTSPEDWPHTSYRFWLDTGYYELGWGHSEPAHVAGMDLQ